MGKLTLFVGYGFSGKVGSEQKETYGLLESKSTNKKEHQTQLQSLGGTKSFKGSSLKFFLQNQGRSGVQYDRYQL